jgi:hypothetical protein
VDRLIARYRVFRSLARQRQPVPALLCPAPRASANLALRLLQVHFCIIYLASGMSKLQGNAWWNGTALWQTMASYEFVRPKFSGTTAALTWLASHRWLWEAALSAGDAFTLVLEIGLPFLIWYGRFRWLLIILAALLHTGIALMMGLSGFSLLMLTILVAFVPAPAVQRLLALLGRGRSQLWLVYQSRAEGQARAFAWVRAFDPYGQVRGLDVSAAPPPADGPARGLGPARLVQLVEEGGEVRSGYAAYERLVRSLRLLWPLALLTWIPGVARLGRAVAAGLGGGSEPAPDQREENAVLSR